MHNPYRKSPMLGGFLICLGAVLMVVCGYFYFDDVPDKPDGALTLLWLAGTGYVLWVAGSVQLARARFSSGWAGLLCGLLLVPGLIALLTVVPTRNRQQIWQEAHPGLSGRAQQRQYRNVKSLY
jgi:hypothetical protein